MRSNDMNDDEILRRYLLGALDEKQADDLELRLLADGELFLLAEAVEGDLLAAAVRGALAPEERGRVLRRLAASPQGRARLALARGLTSLSREEREPAEIVAFQLLARPGVRAAAIAASLAFTAAGFWLATTTAVPNGANMIARALPGTPTAGTPPARHTPPPDAPARQPLAPVTVPAPPEERIAEHREEPATRNEAAPLVLQLALSTVRSAGGDVPRLEAPAQGRRIEIRLPLIPGEPSTSFAAILRNAVTGEEIWRGERLAAREVERRRTLVVSVPASGLPAGLYEIEVHGATPEGDDLLGKPTFEIATSGDRAP
jgi:hypothetical protein